MFISVFPITHFILYAHFLNTLYIRDVSDVGFQTSADADVYADVILRMRMRMRIYISSQMRMRMRMRMFTLSELRMRMRMRM